METNSSKEEQRRVSYLLSPQLVKASDALPSNLGRSSAVHSLVSHLDLLDLSFKSSSRPTSETGYQDDDQDQIMDEDERNKMSLRELFGPELVELIDASENQASKESREVINKAQVIAPREATEKELEKYHSSSYIQSLLDENLNQASGSYTSADRSSEGEEDFGDSSRKRKRFKIEKNGNSGPSDEAFGLTDDNPRFPLLSSHARLIAGSALLAAEELINDRGDVVTVWDGGRHHSKRSSASGFCYVNDAVLAILSLCKPRPVKVEDEVEQSLEISPSSTSVSEIPNKGNILGFGSRPSDIRASITSGNDSSEQIAIDFNTPPSGSEPPIPKQAQKKNKKPKSVLKQSKVLYIDLDLHWGDGVEEAFFNSASVVTLSIHMFAPGFFPSGSSSRPNKTFSTSTPNSSQDDETSPISSHPPGSLHGPSGSSSASHSALNLVLKPGAGPETLARMLKSCVEPFAKVYQPDYLVLQAGVDALAGDPTATFNFSSTSMLSAVSLILSWNIPTLILGGGGYKTQNAAKCWAAITALSLGRWDFDGERDGKLSNESQVPESDTRNWESYSPDFNLEIKEGNMRDENDEGYLLEVEKVFEGHVNHWRKKET